MSSYAELTLGSLSLGASRNRVDPDLIWLFRSSDKRIERITRRNREQLSKYIDDEYIVEYDEHNPFSVVEYRCTAADARDRLNLKGFTYRVAESAFEAGVKNKIRQLQQLHIHLTHGSSIDAAAEDLRCLLTLSARSWIEALTRIQDEALTEGSIDRVSRRDSQLPLLRYMLRTAHAPYGFPSSDNIHYAHCIRLAVEAVSPHEDLVYDLTDIVAGGWTDESAEQVALTEDQMHSELKLAEKVIVLTEGRTDRRFLERSLKLLYPHLADYFHFFEFTGKRNAGGVGELARLVRAFAAARVRHRILALFDNDTAARASLSNLELDTVPSNIAVRRYPDTTLAQHYPTLGPSGETRMDVNGLAGSLELYLGKDVLKNSEYSLTPVRWIGYEKKMRAYQGVLLDEETVRRRFERKLTRCETHPEEIKFHDWEGIRAILDTMFSAFHEVDAADILGRVSQE